MRTVTTPTFKSGCGWFRYSLACMVIVALASCDDQAPRESGSNAERSAVQNEVDSVEGHVEPSVDVQSEILAPCILNVFSQTKLSLRAPGAFWGAIQGERKDVELLGSGTGFLVRAPHDTDKLFVVTAAHVVSRETPSELMVGGSRIRIGEGSYSVETREDRVRISGFAFSPKRLLVDQDMDIAVFELRDDDLRILDRSIDPWYLETTRGPAVRDVVEMFGFPGTASSLLESAVVSDVQRGYFAINRPMAPGFSGSPVVHAGTNSVVGLVSRSTDRYARVISFDKITDLLARFDKEAAEYTEAGQSG